MKRCIISMFAAVVLCSCVGNKAKLIVKVEAIKEGNVELRYITPHEQEGEAMNILYKSTFKDGKIEIELDSLQFNKGRKDCMLFISDNEHIKGASLPVVLEKGRTVKLDIPVNSSGQVTYSGTKHAEVFNQFWNTIQTESVNMSQRNANLNSSYANMEKAFREYIKEYPDAEISYILLTYVVQSMRQDTENALLAYCNELCLESKSDNKWRNTFCEILQGLQLAKITATKIVFTAQDKDGNIYSERDIKGKYILIDFWASWCKPCKEEMPHLKELYTQYKDKGLEIVSISMDSKRHEWLSYLTNNPMPWLSLMGEAQTLSERYGIEYIPFNLLCDEQGNVLQKNIHGAELDNAIKVLFDK
ncbi:MAG: TlpA family protein disulfide reductase [Bacteroidales bacterium]|nr:TlpA family protein disulfide reductase [Bacteroidales bacterium]